MDNPSSDSTPVSYPPVKTLYYSGVLAELEEYAYPIAKTGNSIELSPQPSYKDVNPSPNGADRYEFNSTATNSPEKSVNDVVLELLSRDYTLLTKANSSAQSDDIVSYFAEHKLSNQKVIIRFSCRYSECSMSRLINSYYITSNYNSRKPVNGLPHLVSTFEWEYEPRTCPPNIKGIYPCTELKILNQNLNVIAIYPIDANVIELSKFDAILKCSDILKVIQVVINILTVLKNVHKYGIVINSLTPSNIFIDPQSLEVSIMGFDFSFSSLQENLDLPYNFQNKLYSLSYTPYRAPENFQSLISVDYRADFYDVGVIIYSLLSGKVFKSDNFALFMISLLTGKHESLDAINPFIPKVFSNIISKMMMPNPNSRYLSIDHIIYDLGHAYFKISNEKIIDVPAQKSLQRIPVVWNFELVGRDHIHKHLVTQISTVSVKTETLVGATGVGKTSILKSLQKPALIKKMFFSFWRCHDLKYYDSQFQTFDFILSQLLGDILLMDSSHISFWRDLLSSEVKSDLSILFDKVPELKILLGSHYRRRRGSDIDAMVYKKDLGHHYILKKLFELFSRHAGWVLIIENIQDLSETETLLLEELWLHLKNNFDEGDLSFTLLTSFTTNRNQTLESAEHVPNFLKDHIIKIEPLTFGNVKDIINLSFLLYDSQFLWKKIQSREASYYYEIESSLLVANDRTELAESIFCCSQGYPLLVQKIINRLHFAQLESCDYLNPVNVYKLCVNISNHDFIVNDLFLKSAYDEDFTFNNETMKILKYAACISNGSLFDLYDLSIVSAIDVPSLHKTLFTGTIVSLLEFSSTFGKLPVGRIDEPGFIFDTLSSNDKKNILKSAKFKFAHESIKETLVSQMKASDELAEYYRVCGLRQFASVEGANSFFQLSKEDCFAIASYFINSWCVARPDEHLIYSKVLITAGWCAYSSCEHIAALNYFQIAKHLTQNKDILRGLDWIELHINAVKDRHEKCIELADKALDKYKDNAEDVAQFMITKMQSLISLNKWEDAYMICLDALKILDFELDLSNMDETQITEYTNKVLKPKLPSSSSEIHQLKNLKENTARKILLIQIILTDLNQFSFFLGKLYLLPFCNMMNFSLFMEYGKSVHSSISLIMLASLEASIEAKGIKKAQEYCKLAFSLFTVDTIETNEIFIAALRWYHCLVGSIIEPYEKLDQSFDLSIYNSNVQILQSIFTNSINLKFKFHIWITQGLTLPKLVDRMGQIKKSYQIKSDPGELYETTYRIVVDILQVLTCQMSYTDYVKAGSTITPGEMKTLHIYLIYNTNKCFACYIFNKYELGADIAVNELALSWSEELASIEIIIGRYVFALLIYKDRIRRRGSNQLQSDKVVKKADDIINSNYLFFKELSVQNPSVFLCIFLSVDALMKALNDEVYSQIDTLESFESAIESCAEYQNYLFQAIVAEECARWLNRVSNTVKTSNRYFKLAYVCYKTWGLTAKVEQLEKEFGPIVDTNLDLKTDVVRRQRRNSRHIISNSELDWFHQLSRESIDEIPVLFSDTQATRQKSENYSPFSSAQILCPNRNRTESFVTDEGSISHGHSLWTNNTLPKYPDSVATTTSMNDENKCPSVTSSIEEEECYSEPNVNDPDLDNVLIMNLSVKIAESSDSQDIIRILLIFALNFVHADYGCLVLNSEDQIPYLKAMCLKNQDVRFLSNEILALRGDLVPISLLQECMKRNSSIWRDSDKFYFDSIVKSRDSYFENQIYQNVCCIPIRSGDSEVVGLLYLENQHETYYVSPRKIELLEYICLQSFISINKTNIFEKLEIAKKAAEAATTDRSNFVANMSHEIRTPFNSLMSCAIFLLDTNMTRTQRMYVETIKNSALVTLNIIDGILSFSKLEHGSLALLYEPVDLNACIEDAIQLVAEQVSTQNLELAYINNSYPTDILFGDKTRITQVLINLLGNASKFTSKGFILIESRATEVSKSRYEFKIIVKDSGIGIPPGNKNRVFRIFNQLDGSSVREYGGSGLGLTISKKLAEYMGGDLDFESKEGEGTEFYFTFITKGEEVQGGAPEGVGRDRGKVLIFDSRAYSSESLRKCLERQGFGGGDVIVRSSIDFANDAVSVKGEEVKFLFVFYELIAREEDIRALKTRFPNSAIVLEVPFGAKIPKYGEDGEHGDGKVVDFLLLNPFRVTDVGDILNSGALRREHGTGPKVCAAAAEEKPLLGKRCPLTVLIAEDNAINTKVVRLQLKRLGYTSDHAKDGVEVLEKAEEKTRRDGLPYDLILMDLQMPRKDGFQATEEIKARYSDATRVVALSANVYDEEKRRCVEVGMCGFLNKPLLPDALATQLEDVHRHKVGKVK